jgi:N-acyl amino acid synthase of PEP-CTERM/exosortase system
MVVQPSEACRRCIQVIVEEGKFRFVVADSPELKQAIYRLRYQVYVEECGFEKPEDHPGGLETDPYEPHSLHLAALDEADHVVGTLRLVLHSERGFPIEHAAKIGFVGERPPPERITELSRLAVSRTYRRRREDGLYGVESYLTESEGGRLPDSGPPPLGWERRKRPMIVLGLYRLMYHMSKRMGLTHWYLITEKKIWFALKRYGFLFHQIGDPVEYHGLRIPYLGIVDENERHFAANYSELLEIMLAGLEDKYHPVIR